MKLTKSVFTKQLYAIISTQFIYKVSKILLLFYLIKHDLRHFFYQPFLADVPSDKLPGDNEICAGLPQNNVYRVSAVTCG